MSVIVRFAPSPTGYLHLGNARVAIINWLFAKKNNGKFMLRLDDTDSERSKPEYIQGLYEDLSWLGLDYDIFAKQSDRFERYKECQQKLIESGRLYPCYETFDELEQKRKRQLAKKEPPIYDRMALYATKKDIEIWKNEGRHPHWRFKLNDGDIMWKDLVKGDISFNPCQNLSDPILIKADGTFLYTLSSVVDDLDFGITHIIRGEDHVTNTAVQIQLFKALNSKPVDITFAHLSLLLDAQGQPLSKRLNSFCLKNLRNEEFEPMAINCFLASLGSSKTLYITENLLDLAQNFDLDKIRGGARVDKKSLVGMQHKILHIMPLKSILERFPDILEGVTEEEWNLIRESLDRVSDVLVWKEILHGNIEKAKLSKDDSLYVYQAGQWLESKKINEETWPLWIEHLRCETGRSGRDLAHPLRVAITGLCKGPEMKKLLPLIEDGLVLKRLQSFKV